MNSRAEAILAWGVDIGHERNLSDEARERIDALDGDTDAVLPPGINVVGYNRSDRRPGSGQRIVAVASLVYSAEGTVALGPLVVPDDAQATLDAGMRALGLDPKPGGWLLSGC